MTLDKCWYRDVCNADCYEGCIRYRSMIALCKKANIPKYKWIPTKLYPQDKRDEEAFKILGSVKSSINSVIKTGANITITSEKCGNGKTSWAINLMLNYFNKNWHNLGMSCGGVYVNVPSFLFDVKSNISNPKDEFEELKDRLVEAPIVIWDDIVSGGLTAYEYQILLNYIDKRIMQGKANIFTSNSIEEDAKEYLGDRLFSRVYESSCVIQFYGDGKRGAARW